MNSPVNFTDQSSNSPTSWLWTFTGATPSTSTQQNPSNIVYPSAGSYTVTLAVSNSAGNSSAGNVLVVFALPTAVVSPNVSIPSGQSTTLTSSGGTSFSWSPSAGLNTTVGASVVATPSVTTTYSVTVTDGNGCSGIGQVIVTVTPLGITDPAGNSVLITIYPNPNSGQFTIVPGGNLNSDFQLTVENMLGQVIYSETVSAGGLLNKPISLKGANRGIYLLRIKGEGTEGCSKIIVE